MSPVLRST